MHPPARPLVATYRLQVRGQFDLPAAEGVLDHLAALGVSHAYLAPVLQARAGSTHGYDVVDPQRVDQALGGDAAFESFVAAAHERGLGVVLDIVPNHMAADPDENPWWRDVLRNGRASAFARHFDITWDPPDRKLSNHVLLPVLGDHYGRVVERGELRLERAGAEVRVRYFERTFPLEPRSLRTILRGASDATDAPELRVLARLLDDLAAPTDPDTDPATFAARRADVELFDEVFAQAVARDEVAAAVDAQIVRANADPVALHDVLEQQNYRLARWQTGAQEVDYRRFFDISELVGVRVEDPDVFEATHGAIGRWVRRGLIDGLRVDHPDGLADPARYATALRALAGDRWIVVEKILERGEVLPPWPVDGTTGYELAAAVNGLFVSGDGYRRLAEVTTAALGIDGRFADVVRDAKLEALDRDLAAELRRLTDRLVAVCERQPRYRDFSRRELSAALATALACLPVYRTYVTSDGVASAQDRELVDAMVTEATKARPELDADLLTVIRGALLGDDPFTDSAAAAFRQRFQQLSGAVMAKGKEDTALYRFPVLLAANEVGADPGHAATSIEELHAFLADLERHRPRGMVTLSTHDTKRSDDVRARLDVLSEEPVRTIEAFEQFAHLLAGDGRDVDDLDPLVLHVLFQTLVGAHPLPTDRASTYLEKAVREAGLRTSWTEPDHAFEQTVQALVERATTSPDVQALIGGLVDDLLVDGRVNALAQRLVLLTAPGIPDLYQGSDLWDLSLVDPDNRRPVDFDARATLLRAGAWHDLDVALPPPSTLADPDDPGTPKLALTARTLAVRRAAADAFAPGARYEPLTVRGAGSDHAVAYGRGDEIVVVVPRLLRTLRARTGGWRDTTIVLPDGHWDDALVPGRQFSREVEAATVFDPFPVALLRRRA